MLRAYKEYESLISLWDLIEHPSLGSDIPQQPQVLQPLNLTPDLVNPRNWPFHWSLLLNSTLLAQSEGYWPTRTFSFPLCGRGESLCRLVGNTSVVLLSFACHAEFFYGGRGKSPSFLFFVINSQSWCTFVLHLPCVPLLFSFTWLWRPWLANSQTISLLLVVYFKQAGLSRTNTIAS